MDYFSDSIQHICLYVVIHVILKKENDILTKTVKQLMVVNLTAQKAVK